MPTGVLIQVYVENALDENVLSRLRTELCSDLNLSENDFYAEGPFVPVVPEDYELAGLDGASGQLLSVNLWNAYYGLGYERGDLPLFINVAEWLEQRLPGCRVFYGEDSSGESALFDAAIRNKLLRYYQQVGGKPYHSRDLSHAEFQALFGKYRDEYKDSL